MVQSMKKSGGVPYPHKFPSDISIPEFRVKFEGLPEGDHDKNTVVCVAGRIFSKRQSGASLIFYDLRGDGQKIQIMADARTHVGDFMEAHKACVLTLARPVSGFEEGRRGGNHRAPGEEQEGRAVCVPDQDRAPLCLPPHASQGTFPRACTVRWLVPTACGASVDAA
eukprot:3560764-Rhodomonas_salina.2